jgi:hypothetical protein
MISVVIMIRPCTSPNAPPSSVAMPISAVRDSDTMMQMTATRRVACNRSPVMLNVGYADFS